MAIINWLLQQMTRTLRRILRALGVPVVVPSAHALLWPICPLAADSVSQLAAHLLSLGERDRYLRFGYAATDEQIKRYVDGLKFDRDEIYGVFNNDLQLIAMAHLAVCDATQSGESMAEFGVSVDAAARGLGLGARLFDRAVMHARNQKISTIYIHALSENAPMIRIARKGGAVVERDGSETEAYLRLPRRTLDSRFSELLSDRFAMANYHVKEDAKRFWDFLDQIHEIRQGVRKAREQSSQ
jgi:RimJ/RimL family protein N-acetyltransferase